MKILLLSDRIPPENSGGAEAVAWRLAKALHQHGHTLKVVATTQKNTFEEIRDGIPTVHLHSQYPARFRAYVSLYNRQIIPALKQIYRDFQPDVINAHNVHAHLSYHSLTLARQMKIPAVFSAHDVMTFAYHKLSHHIDPARCDVLSHDAYRLPAGFNLRQMRFQYNPLRNIIIRRILKNTPVRTSPSQALADALHANNLPAFQAVHNGIDVEGFQAKSDTVEALRERLNLHGRKIILFAGRLTGAKGTQPLLQALRQTVKTVPDAMLLVLSAASINSQVSAPEFAELREKHIVSGGWLAGDELVAAFHLADVLVTPSLYLDPFPTVNLEAMAAGTPVIASCYGGSREAVIHEKTGYVVKPYDTEDFATKLGHLLQDDALREQMGQAAKMHVRKHFSIENYVTEMVRVYEQACT